MKRFLFSVEEEEEVEVFTYMLPFSMHTHIKGESECKYFTGKICHYQGKALHFDMDVVECK